MQPASSCTALLHPRAKSAAAALRLHSLLVDATTAVFAQLAAKRVVQRTTKFDFDLTNKPRLPGAWSLVSFKNLESTAIEITNNRDFFLVRRTHDMMSFTNRNGMVGWYVRTSLLGPR